MAVFHALVGVLGIDDLHHGTRLRGELAEALVDCASYVRVGFDSADAEMFNRVKRPRTSEASFDGVCDNVAELMALATILREALSEVIVPSL